MKIIYKESIIDMIVRVKCNAASRNREIKKIIFNKEEWNQLKQEEYGILYPNPNELIETICGIYFEVEE